MKEKKPLEEKWQGQDNGDVHFRYFMFDDVREAVQGYIEDDMDLLARLLAKKINLKKFVELQTLNQDKHFGRGLVE